MTRDDWRRIKEIAAGALDEPESSRAAYVASRCGRDEKLRNEVESLIDSAAKAEGLYETPAALIAGARAAIHRLSESGRARAGERIGAYRVVRELGAGGRSNRFPGGDAVLDSRRQR
jgi:hypothetical protein